MDQVMVDDVVRETIKLAATLDHRVYMLANWSRAVVAPEAKDYYAKHGAAVLAHLKGIVRYGVTEFDTRVTIRTAHVQKERAGSTSNIFGTRQEALEFSRSKG